MPSWCVCCCKCGVKGEWPERGKVNTAGTRCPWCIMIQFWNCCKIATFPNGFRASCKREQPDHPRIGCRADREFGYYLMESLRTLDGSRDKIYCVRCTDTAHEIDWRPRSCYACSKCRALKPHLCAVKGAGEFETFDLRKDRDE